MDTAEGALEVREAARLFTSGLGLERLRHGPAFALGPPLSASTAAGPRPHG